MSHTPLTLEDDIYDPDLHEHDLDEADIVEWYEARPVTLSTAAATGSLLGAFALGALVTVGVLALTGRFDD
mgnify:CR=1 FL=1